jgi:hypothetical protein
MTNGWTIFTEPTDTKFTAGGFPATRPRAPHDPRNIQIFERLLGKGYVEVLPGKWTPLKSEDTKFSEGTASTAKGHDAKKIATSLKALFQSPDKFDGLVTVVQSVDDLTGQLSAQLSQAKTPNAVAGFTHNNRVVLIADNITPGQELGVLLHELGVHLGMESLIGTGNMEKLAGQVERWAVSKADTLEARVAKAAAQRAEASSSENKRGELIAYFVEEAVKAGINPTATTSQGKFTAWFRTLWAAAKAALRKLGLNRFEELTAQNVVDLAMGAAQLETAGTWHGTAASFRKFSHDKMGSGEGRQAFGWGTYLAQNEYVGQDYWDADVERKTYAEVTDKEIVDGRYKALKPYIGETIDETVEDSLGREYLEEGTVLSEAIAKDIARLKDAADDFAIDTVSIEGKVVSLLYVESDLEAKASEAASAARDASPGSLMRVDTNVADDEFIDRDKPLAEQSEHVRKALKDNREKLPKEVLDTLDKKTAGVFIDLMGESIGDKETSEFFDSIGINGLKFRDHNSRYLPDTLVESLQLKIDQAKTSLKGYRHSLAQQISADAKSKSQGGASSTGVLNRLQGGIASGEEHLAKLNAELEEALKNPEMPNPAITRNLVVFNDKNLHRVMTMVGANTEKIKFSEAAEIPKAKVNPTVLSWAKKVVAKEAEDAPYTLVANGNGKEKTLNLAGIYRPVVLELEHTAHILNVHPEITVEDIAALPDLIRRPRAVSGDSTGNNLALYLDARDPSGKPLKVILKNTKTLGRDTVKITEVATMFGESDSASNVARALLDGTAKYLAEKEVARLQRSVELHPAASQPTDPGKPGRKATLLPEAVQGLDPQGGRLHSEREISVTSDKGVVKFTLPTDAPQRLRGEHFSQQGPGARTEQASPEQVAAALKHLEDALGDTVTVETKRWFKDNSSGRWKKRATKNLISLALNGDVLGTAYHESMHEFFDMLTKNGADNVREMLERVSTNKIILRQMEKLLTGHEAALGQLSDPAEAAAYMYQFYQAGLLKLGPQTQSFFERIVALIRKIFGAITPETLDFEMAGHVLDSFSEGAVATNNSAVREAVVKAMSNDTASREQALKNAGNVGTALVRQIGKVLFSAHAMMEATGNKFMVEIADMANQKTGKGMGERQSYFDALAQQKGVWMNKLDAIVSEYDKDALELAREVMSTGVESNRPEVRQVVAKLKEFFADMHSYAVSREVKRMTSYGNWEALPHRKNYFPRVWSTETLANSHDEFIKMLIEHHSDILGNIASAVMRRQQAIGEAVEEVSAGDIAEEIYTRMINANGQVELTETTSDLGISPMAAAVNRRTLNWIDMKAFDKFTEKDMGQILTGYTVSMVKRAEYTQVFGNGGEHLTRLTGYAVLQELGGNTLIREAERGMYAAIDQWNTAKAVALDAGREFDEPFPTIRSVGQKIHQQEVGEEQASKDLTRVIKHLEQGFKVVQAIEGTLGREITPMMRKMTSLAVVYQNIRLMVPSLFSQFNDVLGLSVAGGTLKDSFDGFVRAMREIRAAWGNIKVNDRITQRGEAWGTVESRLALDALGQTYGSMFLAGKAKKMNDALFRWNGMEAWNRAMRLTATSVAERQIAEYARNGLDTSDKAAVAKFERLFGKEFSPKGIKLDEEGNPDIQDTRNQRAVARWVDDAVMRPNPMQRTIWGSDPRFAAFWQFKQFAYSLHQVMIKGALGQAKLGNYRPLLVMLAGYAPVMIAGDAVKEMLIPGDEPPWMKQGLGALLTHGVERAGIGGIPQLLLESRRHYGADMFGPSVSQLANILTSDKWQRPVLSALPAGGLLQRAAS